MRVVVFIVFLFAFSPLINQNTSILEDVVMVRETSHHSTVTQFGVGFEEIVIADSSDGLDIPRDLEFHPGSSRSY